MKKLIPAFICLLLAVPCQARTIFVDANTPDNNDGSSWAKAYKYLQDAFADANSTGDVNEIREQLISSNVNALRLRSSTTVWPLGQAEKAGRAEREMAWLQAQTLFIA